MNLQRFQKQLLASLTHSLTRSSFFSRWMQFSPLSDNQRYALHIHDTGNPTKTGCANLGKHWNPFNVRTAARIHPTDFCA